MKKNLLIMIGVAVAFSVLGFLLGQQMSGGTASSNEAEWAVANHFPELSPINDIGGRVVRVGEDHFFVSDMVQTKRFPQEDGSDREIKEIKVMVDANTVIYTDRMPTEEELALPLEEMRAASRNVLSLSDLVEGTSVRVTSADDARQSWQMRATEVRVVYLPVTE